MKLTLMCLRVVLPGDTFVSGFHLQLSSGLCQSYGPINKIVNFVSIHAAFYRIMLSPFGRNAHDCLVYFDVSWRDIGLIIIFH